MSGSGPSGHADPGSPGDQPAPVEGGGAPGEAPLVPAPGAPLTPAGPGAAVPFPPSPPSSGMDLDLAAASLRLDTADTDSMFEVLGDKLARVLGARAQVQREGGLRRNKRVSRIVVDTAAARLEARRSRTGPQFLAVHAVRGITLQTAEIDAAEWMERLVTAVRDEAARSNDVRTALGRLLD